MSIVVRPLQNADLPAIVGLNDEAVPAVPPTDRGAMAQLAVLASLALVAEQVPGTPLGFLIAMDPGIDHASENYRWFSDRGDSFVYIDRIVVAPEARGTGIGRLLYEAVFERAREHGFSEVDCEVNVRPANPQSLAFHERMGFDKLDEQETKGGAYRVALLAAQVQNE